MLPPPMVLATPFSPPFAPPHRPEARTAASASAHEENYVVATPVLLPPPPTAPPLTTTNNKDYVDRRIERTNELDGSLSIVITTTTTRQIDGHREVRIETYRVPPGDEAGWAAALSSMSSFNAPSNAYLTRVEVRTSPPCPIVSSSDGARNMTEENSRLPDAGNARLGTTTMTNPAYFSRAEVPTISANARQGTRTMINPAYLSRVEVPRTSAHAGQGSGTIINQAYLSRAKVPMTPRLPPHPSEPLFVEFFFGCACIVIVIILIVMNI